MDERMQFVARRLGDGGALQGVWDLSKDGLQDLRSLSAMRHSGADRPQPASLPLRQSTSVSGRELHHERKARASQLGCPQDPRTFAALSVHGLLNSWLLLIRLFQHGPACSAAAEGASLQPVVT